ncbi:MAG: 30S ribosomal protein S12 methylthiotransferase RimO [Planctomycetota bacterium JB042]
MSDAPITISLISLGCPKNLVDSEVLIGRLWDGPFDMSSEPAGSDVVVVNTCGFIGPARDESIETVEEMLRLKERGDVKGVVVAGCLVARLGAPLAERLPGVDAFLDLSDYSDAPDVLRRIAGRASSPGRAEAGAIFAGGGSKTAESDLGRGILTLPHTAYLRISEGCDRKCSFCAIPLIRGTQRSKPLEVLVEEAAQLAGLGVRELSLVGEETTAWGSDLGHAYGEGITELLGALDDIEGIDWIRLLYAHPGSFRPSLVEAIRDLESVAKYVDMPVQHGDDDVLKAMKRGTPVERIRGIVRDLRDAVPFVTLRTTILVGFPGETEARFENLMAFLEEARFERLGCFVYSREEGTSSYGLEGAVPTEVAEERRDRVMTLQQRIARERNEALVGYELDVMVDVAGEGGTALGRTEGDAPQIDSAVHLTGEGLSPGSIVIGRVTGTAGYDLEATVA